MSFAQAETSLTPPPSDDAPVQLSRAAPVQREACGDEKNGDEAHESQDPNAPPEPGVTERAGLVRQGLTALERAAADRIASHARWLSRNWTLFIGATNGNPSLAYPESDFLSLASGPSSKSVGGAALEVGRSKVEQAAIDGVKDQVGKAVAESVGTDSLKTLFASSAALSVVTPIGILAGLAWAIVKELLASAAADKERHAQAKAQAAATVERLDYFNAQADQVLGDRRLLYDSCASAIDGARTHAVLDRIEGWITSERGWMEARIEEGDTSLRDSLLAHWVLQHSAAPGEANDTTSQSAYDEATAGEPEYLDVVQAGTKTLFVHQMRFGLLTHGLMDPTVCDAIERKATSLFAAGGADQVVSAFDGLVVRIPRVSSPRIFAREVEASQAGILSVDNAVMPDFLHPAEKGHVRTEVTLHLDEDEGCAVLGSLAFLATCVDADDREAYLTGQTLIDWERSAAKSEGGFTTAEWEWEP